MPRLTSPNSIFQRVTMPMAVILVRPNHENLLKLRASSLDKNPYQMVLQILEFCDPIRFNTSIHTTACMYL